MNHLLDVNVLLAWGWVDHTEHRRVASWITAMKKKRGVALFTSAIPERGFVRVSVQEQRLIHHHPRPYSLCRTFRISGDGRKTCKQTIKRATRPPLHAMVIRRALGSV